MKKATRKERRDLGADAVAVNVQMLGLLSDLRAMVRLFEVGIAAVEELERAGVLTPLEVPPRLSRPSAPGLDPG